MKQRYKISVSLCVILGATCVNRWFSAWKCWKTFSLKYRWTCWINMKLTLDSKWFLCINWSNLNCKWRVFLLKSELKCRMVQDHLRTNEIQNCALLNKSKLYNEKKTFRAKMRIGITSQMLNLFSEIFSYLPFWKLLYCLLSRCKLIAFVLIYLD